MPPIVDTNGDGLISFAEAEAITFLDVSDKGISNLTGIALFINLEGLLCYDNELRKLNCSNKYAELYVLEVYISLLIPASMNAADPGLIDYLRSGTKIHFLFKKHKLLRRNLLLFDAFVVFAAFLLAYSLRFAFDLNTLIIGHCLLQSVFVLLVYLGFEALFKAFAGLPKPTVFQNIVGVLISATMSLAFIWLFVFLIPENGWLRSWANIPLSILLIHYLFSIVLLILIRLCCKTKI